MNELIVSAQAESEMDDIWLSVARASQNVETANLAIDMIASRFGLLARYPALGRDREDLGRAFAVFTSWPSAAISPHYMSCNSSHASASESESLGSRIRSFAVVRMAEVLAKADGD